MLELMPDETGVVSWPLKTEAEQLRPMTLIRISMVQASVIIQNVVLLVPRAEVKGTFVSCPPGRELLLTSPYCGKKIHDPL